MFKLDFYDPINFEVINCINLNSNFIVLSFYTENYENEATKLIGTLDFFQLDRLVIKIPTIHQSVSPKGTDNIAYSKPNLIRTLIKILKKPILYLDCDVLVKKYPSIIDELVMSNSDFSILNWLALEDNTAYIKSNLGTDNTNIYSFSHEILFSSTDQLICSGAVQFWSNSNSSIALLNKWYEVIKNNPLSQDDHSLDCAFNNFNSSSLKYSWLPKSYARYGWWIFDEPVIDHPHLPNSNNSFIPINDSLGCKRIYMDKLSIKSSTKVFDQNIFFMFE